MRVSVAMEGTSLCTVSDFRTNSMGVANALLEKEGEGEGEGKE